MESKIKLSNGLNVNKEALTKLQESQMAKILAGTGEPGESSSGASCSCKDNSCSPPKTEA